MKHQTLFDTVESITGHQLLESEIIEILAAIEADKNKSKHLPPIETIVNAVAKLFGLNSDTLRSRTNKREIVEPRQLCFALLMFGLKLSSVNTGFKMGFFDHATVLYGISKVSERYHTYRDYRETVNELLTELFNEDQRAYISDRIRNPKKDTYESFSRLVTA